MICLLTLLVNSASYSVALGVSWIGSPAGVWDVASNWNTSMVPSTNDNVLFTGNQNGISYTIAFLLPSYTITSLTIGSSLLSQNTVGFTLMSNNVSNQVIFNVGSVAPKAIVSITLSRSEQQTRHTS